MRAYGIDPVDRCNPPICYEEHSITVDCGHGRNGAGVLIFKKKRKRAIKEMEIKTQRKTYTDKLNEVECAIVDTHAKVGKAIAAMRRVGLVPNRDLMLSYDSLLAASNDIKVVKTFSPSIVFADETNEK